MMVWTATPQNLTVTNLSYTNQTITGTVSGLPSSALDVTITAWKDIMKYMPHS